MKKLALFMTLVMAMALAVPAYAGVSTEITGKVAGKVEYKDGELSGVGTVETKIELSAGSDGALKAVVNLASWSTSESDQALGKGAFAKNGDPLTLNIESAYVEAQGAWFKGAPDVTTKFGRFGTNYDEWIGDINDNEGTADTIELSNIDLGVGSLAFSHSWVDPDDDANTDNANKIIALTGSASVDIVELSGTYLSQTDENGDNVTSDYAVHATATPVDGVEVNASFAGIGRNVDTVDSDTAYEVSGTLSTIPDLTVSVKNWKAGADFKPLYATWDDGSDALDNDVRDAGQEETAFDTNSAGYEVSASTTQSGVDLSLTYNNTTDAAGNNAVTTTTVKGSTTVAETDLSAEVVSKSSETSPKFVLSAGKSFGDINGSYKLTREHDESITHEISADTTVDTPVADGVALSAKVKLPDASDAQADVDASWTAPNGFGLGLHYANYAGGDYAEGFSARASIEVTF